MLTLYQFPPSTDVFSASPFCAKLEAFLRWQKIPYKPVIVKDMRSAPKGKVPYIEDENGKMGDSGLIIEYLCKKHNLSPDAPLDDAQRAQARAIRYLCEEGLYRAMAYFRFVDPDGWRIMSRLIASRFGIPMRWFLVPHIHKYVRNQLIQQGIARHSRDEIIAIAQGDLKALSTMLGDKPFLFGNGMTTADLCMFSVVGNLITGSFSHPVRDYAQSQANLVAHVGRVKQACFNAS